MVIDKSPLLDDLTPLEAPPSYDALGAQGIYLPGQKPLDPLPNLLTSTSLHPRSSISPIAKSLSSSTSLKVKSKANNWFNFNYSRTTREVRATVLLLVRDLVREQNAASEASLSILESCAEACAGHSLTLSTLLQEKFIENHTPLYWAVVKRPPDSDSVTSDLLTSLISFASPLTPQTISDIRHACLLTSDQLLFQRLRMSPEFASLSGTDEMLLGGLIPPDNVTVEDLPGDEGSFAVNFEIVRFQKRMLVSNYIDLEFIARARMWKLVFFIAQDHRDGPRPGSWCISLSLLENSPPTWIDSRLIIPEPAPAVSPELSPLSTSSPLRRAKTKLKPKPTIIIRLKSSQQLVAASTPSRVQATSVVVSLEDSMMGSGLQYTGTSYIALDETLRARLEAHIGKPSICHPECIIC